MEAYTDMELLMEAMMNDPAAADAATQAMAMNAEFL